jgi:hypothetical protein
MAYVIQEDILASIEETLNVVQGNSQTYSIQLDRDFLGNPVSLQYVTSISVEILNETGDLQLVFGNPVIPGVSQQLNVGSVNTNNAGNISFEIIDNISRYLDPGDLFARIRIVYSNYFPSAKTYTMPLFKIGRIIAGELVDDPDVIIPTPVQVISRKPFGSSEYMIQYIDSDIPSRYGYMSVNSQDPSAISIMTFRNLDLNLIRPASLENFVVNRMGVDNITGIITLFSIDNPSFYAIYKILTSERIDVIPGNGVDADSDGIRLKVVLEDFSRGPGVNKSIWQVGDNVAFSIDAHGITVKPEGVLTYTDKNKRVAFATNGAGSPTGIYITYSPYKQSYVMVEVNGISVDVGDGAKNKTVYFSGNNGETSMLIGEIRREDQLIWNGNIAGFELEVGDEINLIYEIDYLG